MTRYPEGLLEYVFEHYKDLDRRELAAEVNKRFGTNMKPETMGSLKKRYGLSGGPRSRVYTDTFPEEVSKFIDENYKGTGYQAMADLLFSKFGIKYDASQIKSFYKNHRLNSGLTGRFKKGQEAHNKGQKVSPETYEKMKRTMFKKGDVPHNWYPVGTIVKNGEGFFKIKVAEPNKWEFLHRHEWEKVHGKIKDGSIIIFKDGNRENCNIENLMEVSRSEHGFLNIRHLRSEYPDVTESGAILARLIIETKKIRKGKK